jgi:deoxyribonuclease V
VVTHACCAKSFEAMVAWPRTEEELIADQRRLALTAPSAWQPPVGPLAIGGCFVCFPRGAGGAGAAGDPAWAAAVARESRAVVRTSAGAPYLPGLLALREGRALEAAVRALPARPEVLLVNATGRDHPRRAGLALHLGAVLGLPSVGVTHRLLVARGEWPAMEARAHSPIRLEGELLGYWLRTRAGVRPLAVHAGWRTSPGQALEIVEHALARTRTPEPLRQARRLAREARAFEVSGAGKPRRT